MGLSNDARASMYVPSVSRTRPRRSVMVLTVTKAVGETPAKSASSLNPVQPGVVTKTSRGFVESPTSTVPSSFAGLQQHRTCIRMSEL